MHQSTTLDCTVLEENDGRPKCVFFAMNLGNRIVLIAVHTKLNLENVRGLCARGNSLKTTPLRIKSTYQVVLCCTCSFPNLKRRNLFGPKNTSALTLRTSPQA